MPEPFIPDLPVLHFSGNFEDEELGGQGPSNLLTSVSGPELEPINQTTAATANPVPAPIQPPTDSLNIDSLGRANRVRKSCFPCFHARRPCDLPARRAEAVAKGIDIITNPVCCTECMSKAAGRASKHGFTAGMCIVDADASRAAGFQDYLLAHHAVLDDKVKMKGRK